MSRAALLLFLLPGLAFCQTWQVNSDFWTATDALGRTTPTAEEAGPVRDGKYVAIFYWTWHTDQLADFSPVMNTSEILRQHPEAASDPDHPAWKGIWGGVFWWDEPLFGYYRTTDEWVLRKHAEMLADARIDAVFFDCTNGSYTWKSSYTKLLQVWERARRDGVHTPQIAFMLPFGATDDALTSIKQIYRDLYQPGLYRDLWFMWKGKPVIMAYPEMVRAKLGESAGLQFTADSRFLGIDVHCPSWSNNLGSLTLSLYRWRGAYMTSVASQPIARKTFDDFPDNAWLKLTFEPQDSGAYLWVLSNPTEMVGVWKDENGHHGIQSYFNGRPVMGAYECGIYLAPDSTRQDLVPETTSHVAVQLKEGCDASLAREIKEFFTFRPGQPDYVKGPVRDDQWGWLEVYPQHGFGGAEHPEEVTVGVAQNASDASGGRCYAFNAPGTYGRSYTQQNGQDPRPDAYLYGLNFQEQWSRAFELDPELVFVTGWNEWTAGRFRTWGGCIGVPFPNAFPDEYNWDKSRDVEPVKSWGRFGDVYYLQLVSNVRRFKGMAQQEPPSGEKTIAVDQWDAWSDVKPTYRDYRGDTLHRNHRGQGNQLVYVNETGRNDIVLAKVARDRRFLTFYAETASALTPRTDPRWMRLWIDVDRDKSTGWEGYDFVVNRVSPDDSAAVERSVGGWNWRRVGSAAYAVQGNRLAVRIPRALLGLTDDRSLNFEFKWSDNAQQDGDIMAFYVDGDAAPGGRFNYVYRVAGASGVRSSDPLPTGFSLFPNYPNPFNSETVISYRLKRTASVKLAVYDLTGRRVRLLFRGNELAGYHRVRWDGRDDSGVAVSSGVYVARLTTTDGTTREIRMVLQR